MFTWTSTDNARADWTDGGLAGRNRKYDMRGTLIAESESWAAPVTATAHTRVRSTIAIVPRAKH